MLLSEAVEQLAIATRANGRTDATVQAYREKLSYMLNFLGNVAVETITIHDLRRYVASLWDQPTRWAEHAEHNKIAGGLSPFTVAGRVRAFKRLFNFLIEEEVIAENPARHIKIPTPKRREPKGISTQDFLALLETCKTGEMMDLRDRAILCFLFDTGCRARGLCGLHIGDLKLDEMRATVIEKGDKPRIIPFTEPTREALKDWLEVRPQVAGDWLFVRLSSHKPGPISPNGLGQMLIRRGKKAGTTGPINPHAFRHAFAINFLLNGGDIGILSKLMGHEGVDITIKWYGIFVIGQLQEQHRRHSTIMRLLRENNHAQN